MGNEIEDFKAKDGRPDQIAWSGVSAGTWNAENIRALGRGQGPTGLHEVTLVADTKVQPDPEAPVAAGDQIIQPGNPKSWNLPTRENYSGWMPGDDINLQTFGDDAEKYVQAIMQQNYTVDEDGKRVSLFDNSDQKMRERFANSARHAVGMGDLRFNQGLSPGIAEQGMFLHEPQSWLQGMRNAVRDNSITPFIDQIGDSLNDQQNNAYLRKKSFDFQNFDSFIRQMLNDCWISAKNGSAVIRNPQEFNK